MAKKGFFGGILALTLIFGLIVVGCSSVPAGLPSNYGDKGLSAGQGESEIIVQRPNVNLYPDAMNIFVDDQLRLTLRNAESGMVIVPNGNHTIYTKFDSRPWKSENILVNANSNRITLVATPKAGFPADFIELNNVSEVPLRSSSSE